MNKNEMREMLTKFKMELREELKDFKRELSQENPKSRRKDRCSEDRIARKNQDLKAENKEIKKSLMKIKNENLELKGQIAEMKQYSKRNNVIIKRIHKQPNENLKEKSTSGYQCKRHAYEVLITPFVRFFLFFSVFSTGVQILF